MMNNGMDRAMKKVAAKPSDPDVVLRLLPSITPPKARGTATVALLHTLLTHPILLKIDAITETSTKSAEVGHPDHPGRKLKPSNKL